MAEIRIRKLRLGNTVPYLIWNSTGHKGFKTSHLPSLCGDPQLLHTHGGGCSAQRKGNF